jgi:hypothetical protein
MFQPEKFSDYTAILALFVSGISLAFSILNYRRQGGILKFHLEFDPKNTGEFLLRVENKGFHSVKINQVRMIVGKKAFNVDGEGFEIDYGKNKMIKISLAGYKDFHAMEVSRIEVLDVADHIYKISTRNLRRKIRR